MFECCGRIVGPAARNQRKKKKNKKHKTKLEYLKDGNDYNWIGTKSKLSDLKENGKMKRQHLSSLNRT